MYAPKSLSIAVLLYGCSALNVNNSTPKFRVIAFFTAKQDQAHISFVHDANFRLTWGIVVGGQREVGTSVQYTSRSRADTTRPLKRDRTSLSSFSSEAPKNS